MNAINSITKYVTFIVTLVIMICSERRNRWMYRWISDPSVFRYKIPRDELEAWAIGSLGLARKVLRISSSECGSFNNKKELFKFICSNESICPTEVGGSSF
jgi:hypothetical protein